MKSGSKMSFVSDGAGDGDGDGKKINEYNTDNVRI